MPLLELPELSAIERIIELGGSHLRHRVVERVCVAAQGELPLHVITMGNPDPAAPSVGYFGGVHGLERIGTEVVTAFLYSLVMRLAWDVGLHRQLESIRLVFMPLVNPGGMWLGTRANPRGVDLMRNAPVDAVHGAAFFAGGQRWSARLPWYRGNSQTMESESLALQSVVQDELLCSGFSLSVDCHSGFGVRDRIWFPFAHTTQPMAHLAEMHAFGEIFFQSHSHHRYVLEPQSCQYLTHGDLWDHLYQQSLTDEGRRFLPLTLEMGSWLWIKKNPRQMFSRHGIFNPLIEHRQQRVLRQHQMLLDFLARAALGHERWVPTGDERTRHHASALRRWY